MPNARLLPAALACFGVEKQSRLSRPFSDSPLFMQEKREVSKLNCQTRPARGIAKKKTHCSEKTLNNNNNCKVECSPIKILCTPPPCVQTRFRPQRIYYSLMESYLNPQTSIWTEEISVFSVRQSENSILLTVGSINMSNPIVWSSPDSA